MYVAIDAALWVVGKALAPVTDGLLESWAASAELGPNIDALKMELLYAQGMLGSTQGRDIRNPALKELLNKLRQLAYGADDVLDELDYYRIQDAVNGTYHAADLNSRGYVDGLVLNARHIARAGATKLNLGSSSHDASHDYTDDQEEGGKQGCLFSIRLCGGHETSSSPSQPTNRCAQDINGGCMPKIASCARSATHTIGKHFPCYSFPSVHDDVADTVMLESSNMTGNGRRFLCGAWPSKAPLNNHAAQAPELKFCRVEMSSKMMELVEQLKPLCAKVSTILDKELLGSAILKLELLGSNRTPIHDNAINRPKTTPKIIEPELYGRDDQKRYIVDGITHGKYCTNELNVLPLVGPGGIGKTTLTQHIYKEVQSSFQVSIWICVSLDFSANRLAQEMLKKIPKVDDEKENASDEELIEQRLKSKRVLLVLDDVWTYHEDEWKKLVAPLRYSGGDKGNVVLVTTRIPKVASMVSTTNYSIDVERLGHEDIMPFFEICVFGDQQPWEDHPELRDIGTKIVNNLKGFPLAVKTVGRLLRNQLTLDHWTRVAESREWELQTNDDDIMPALKLSYDFLPFHLQQCFSCCALFPEDYEFGNKELVHIWIGLDFLHSRDQTKRIEDVGIGYLNDLVNHGFFKMNENENGPYYVIHDLLHDLAVKVSSYEYLSIYSTNVRSIQIPASVRHLSIIVDSTDVNDTLAFEHYKSNLGALGKRLKVQNLRTLMLFGEYHGSFAKTFRDMFREARALRIIFLSGASYSPDDMLLNFSKLVHLRYIKIKSVCNKDMCLPSALFRSYHLEVIDLKKRGGSFGSTSQMSNLIKLRHFAVPRGNLELHSSIYDVRKLKFIEELRRFEVGKETEGFELSQLGELTELGGSLGIYNLEKVRAKEEGKELKLIHKNHLHKLTLEWDIHRPNKDPPQEENVLESLIPHKNLQSLSITGHGGANCPSWLGGNLLVKNLESLSLYDVSWNTLPPLGKLSFVDDPEECTGRGISQSFQTLKRLELAKIPRLTKWVGNGKCCLFSLLEVVIIEDCSELTELPFSHPNCCQAKQEENMTWFPKLQKLKITKCPKLLSLPPIPWTQAPCSAEIARAGPDFEKLLYSTNYRSELSLSVKGKNCQHSMVWNGLSFHNLSDLKELVMVKCPPLPLIHLQKLKSLKTLKITDMSNGVLLSEGDSHHIASPLPVERIVIERCDADGKELTQLLSHFPKLRELDISLCEEITGLGVVEHQMAAAPPVSSSAYKIEHADIGHQQQWTRGEEELAVASGLLLLPAQLQELRIWYCPELSLLSNSVDNNNPGGGGLQSLCSLHLFRIQSCPKFFSSYSSSAFSCFPFPTFLRELILVDMEGMEMLAPLSNLISLTTLLVNNCGGLKGEGLWPLIAKGPLTALTIYGTPKFFTNGEPSGPHDEVHCSYTSKLRHLDTDDLLGVLLPPICRLLSSSLTKLTFSENKEVERFTEEQEESLHLLASLQELEFFLCQKLQNLPAGLTKLTNLNRLEIRSCQAIRSLPKDGLPSALQGLVILGCPAIKSLPNNCLPSSLRELYVGASGNSEELRKQCCKLKGTIPIIRDYD